MRSGSGRSGAVRCARERVLVDRRHPSPAVAHLDGERRHRRRPARPARRGRRPASASCRGSPRSAPRSRRARRRSRCGHPPVATAEAADAHATRVQLVAPGDAPAARRRRTHASRHRQRIAPPLARHHLDREPAQPDVSAPSTTSASDGSSMPAADDRDVARHPVQVDVGGHSRNATESDHQLRSRPMQPAPERVDRDREPGRRAWPGTSPAPPRARCTRAPSTSTSRSCCRPTAADLVTRARDAFGRGRGRRRVRRRRHRVRARRASRPTRAACSASCRSARATTSPASSTSPAATSMPPSTCCAPATWCGPTSGARTPPTAPRRGSPRSPTPGSTRWRTCGPTTSRGPAGRRSTCSPRCARSRRTRPRPCASPSTARTIETEAWLVAVGNTRTYASGMMITPAAERARRPARRVRRRSGVARRLPAHVPVGVQRHARRPPARSRTARGTARHRRGPRRPCAQSICGRAASTRARCRRASNRSPGALAVVVAAAPTRRLLDGERAFHALRAVPGDAAVEGVLPGLQVDLLRLRAATAVGLELEARVGAVEHEVVDARSRR